MNKSTILTFFVMFTSLFSFSQIKITDQHGNIKTVQPGNEPWQVQGTTNAATANNQNIYQNGNVAIGDFSSSAGTATLDVDGNVRVRTMPLGTNRGTTSTAYPNNVIAKSDGTLGYVPYNVTQILLNGTQLSPNTTFALIISGRITDIRFPTTEAEGAYDGRIVVLRNDGATGTNVRFNNFAGQAIKYAGLTQSGSDLEAYSYDQIPSRSILTLMYLSSYSRWVILSATTTFTGSNR